MKIIDRYSTAIRSQDMGSDPKTIKSDSDVIGAAGIAAKASPLGIALMRLLAGDNRSSAEVVEILAGKAVGKGWRMGMTLSHPAGVDLGRAVLAWHRHGTCRHCHGHGVLLIPGTRTLGSEPCPRCIGGRRILEREVAPEHAQLARWLASEIERELAFAGPAAMAALAPSLAL